MKCSFHLSGNYGRPTDRHDIMTEVMAMKKSLQVKIMLVIELTSMEDDILNKDLGRRHIQQIKETHYSKFN